jgi:hypothetical protein
MELLESVSKSVTYDARSFSEPLSQEILFRWHKMIVSGRRDLKDLGRYRTGLADAGCFRCNPRNPMSAAKIVKGWSE